MKWFYFILSHSIFIAICAVALVWQTVQFFFLPPSIYLYGFVFFIVLFGYNFYWILSKYSFRANISFSYFLNKEIAHIFLVMASCLGVIFCYTSLKVPIEIILPAIVLTSLYCLPLVPIKFLRFTRKFGVLKTITLAFTWSYATVVIPLQKTIFYLNKAEFFILSLRFLFMLMLCLIFDNRDVAVDKMRGLHSLATDLSAKTVKWLILIIFSVLFATNFLSKFYGITTAYSIGLQISTITLLIVYLFSTKKQGYVFYYFWVDGMMLFSAIITYIAGFI